MTSQEKTEQAFFIAAGLGRQLIDGQTVFFLSPYSPLGKLLQRKKTGDHFLFNKKEVSILAVY